MRVFNFARFTFRLTSAAEMTFAHSLLVSSPPAVPELTGEIFPLQFWCFVWRILNHFTLYIIFHIIGGFVGLSLPTVDLLSTHTSILIFGDEYLWFGGV